MRIVLLVDSFYPYVSGVSVHYAELIKGLVKKGHKVLVIIPKGAKEVKLGKEFAGADFRFVSSIPSLVVPNLRIGTPNVVAIWKEVKEFAPDIIESSSPSILGIDGQIMAKMMGIPYVPVFHTLFTSAEYVKAIFKILGGKTMTEASLRYHQWYFKSGDGVFAATPIMKKKLLQMGVSSHKIYFSPILTDISKVKILDAEQKEKLKKKLKLGEKVAVYLGRLAPEKGLDVLVEAWKKVNDKHRNYSLLIIGSGPFEMKLKDIVKKLSLEKSVIFAGELEHDKMVKSGILSVADAYVSASTIETWGLASIEAMAHKLPMVLARAQGICELAGGAEVLCKPGDVEGFAKAINKILENKKLRKGMGDKARKIAEKYTAEKGVDKIIDNYKKVIARFKSEQAKNIKVDEFSWQ